MINQPRFENADVSVDGIAGKALKLNAETLRVLSDRAPKAKDECTENTGCNCNIDWSMATYLWFCCD